MAPSQKRKGSPADDLEDTNAKRRFIEGEAEQAATEAADPPAQEHSTEAPSADAEAPAEASAPSNTQADRLARFKALKARQAAGTKANAKEVQRETDRSKINPDTLKKLDRKNAIASQKLLREDVESEGGDFERKRAWDWTVDESEKWDERMAEKARRRGDVEFSNYEDEARKVYERQMRDVQVDLEGYEREKREKIQRAAESGGLEIVETETGELIAVDRDGTFLSTGEEVDFNKKPTKEALDRLVKDIKTAEEVRMEKRRQRNKARGEQGGDTTSINTKNRDFNDKLKRFYDKYTADIRENFERGTAM